MNNRMDGGHAVVQWLKAAGVAHVFSVSGGPLNPIYRACRELDLPLIHARHEAAACFMGEAASRVTGVPGAVAVTLGPGVTNTVTPALVATMAGTPLIIIGAQAGTASFERGAGMSWDPLPILTPVTKWCGRVLDPARIQEYLEIAWRHMWDGRPGPVFLEIPIDILSGVWQGPAEDTTRPPVVVRPGLDKDQADRLADIAGSSSRPILILGDEYFWDRTPAAVRAIERHNLAFATMRLARGAVDETRQSWIGPAYLPCNATLRQALEDADCVFLIGHHFEFDLDFGTAIGQDVKIIQTASDTALLNRNRRAELALAASPSSVLDVLAKMPPLAIADDWTERLAGAWRKERDEQIGPNTRDGLHPVAAIDAVCAAAPKDTIFVTSHGNVDFWADARLRITEPGRYLRAGQSGALGAEVPYGLGAKFADPEAPVVVFVGDGGVGYHGVELDTAGRYRRPFIVVVLDDQKWGAIALPQQASYGTSFEMDLPRRDWREFARGLGGRGDYADSIDAVATAVKKALASDKPSLIQIPVCSVISPYMEYISR
jgi:acetolactate synthase-1/2/3 large subunit